MSQADVLGLLGTVPLSLRSLASSLSTIAPNDIVTMRGIRIIMGVLVILMMMR